MKKIKWLLVGAGDIANSRIAPALYDAADSELVAICATSKRQVDVLAAKMGVSKIYYDFEQALAETDADSVYIATPHHLHVEMCLDALKADKHVLCEKPLGINGAECLKLLAAVKKSNKIAACSNYRLFTNQFKTTHDMIKNGEVGNLVGGWAHNEENYYNPGNTPYLEKLGMSPILGYGFYLINLSQILFGMPSEVFAMMTSFNCDNKPDYDIDDLENILLRYPDGRQFSIVLNMTANAPLRHSYQFYGSKGRIYWPECPPHFNSPIFKITDQDGIEEITDSYSGITPDHKPNWHLPMIEDFIRSIQTGTQPVCTIESAAKTAVITDAVIRSAETGRLETINWKE
jgi:predicted dehydrogenase